jgi:hypothetical protein
MLQCTRSRSTSALRLVARAFSVCLPSHGYTPNSLEVDNDYNSAYIEASPICETVEQLARSSLGGEQTPNTLRDVSYCVPRMLDSLAVEVS